MYNTAAYSRILTRLPDLPYGKRIVRPVCCWTVLLAIILAGPRMVLGADAPLFEKGVEQIFRAKCLACHGANKQKRKAELDLRWVSAILKGGESGPAVVPGKLDESILWDMVSTGEMPPEEKNQLTQTELDIVKSWILKGAKTKQKKEAETEHLEARNFWSFQKLQQIHQFCCAG